MYVKTSTLPSEALREGDKRTKRETRTKGKGEGREKEREKKRERKREREREREKEREFSKKEYPQNELLTPPLSPSFPSFIHIQEVLDRL